MNATLSLLLLLLLLKPLSSELLVAYNDMQDVSY